MSTELISEINNYVAWLPIFLHERKRTTEKAGPVVHVGDRRKICHVLRGCLGDIFSCVCNCLLLLLPGVTTTIFKTKTKFRLTRNAFERFCRLLQLGRRCRLLEFDVIAIMQKIHLIKLCRLLSAAINLRPTRGLTGELMLTCVRFF